MSTPADEKRKARLDARKANLANAQAARRPLGDDAEDDTASIGETSLASDASSLEATPDQFTDEPTEDIIAAPADAPPPIVAASEAEVPVQTTPTTPAKTSNGATAGKTGSAKTAGTTSRTPSRPITSGATAGKTPTRPLTGGATVGKSNTSSMGKSSSTPGTASKTPSRPLAAAATAGASTRLPGMGASYRIPTHAEAAEAEDVATKTKRDVRRETRMADLARVQTERKRALAQKKFQSRLRLWGTVGGIALVVVVLSFLIYNLTGGNTSSAPIKSGYGAGITCGAETNAVHYHTNIQIYVNGKNQPVPASIGFGTNDTASGCLYWLHVHKSDGVIHIEAPTDAANRKFMVGDLIAIWNLTQSPANTIAAGPPQLSTTQFFGLPVDKQHPLTIYVDPTGSGKFTVYTGDPNKIVMSSHENIWFEYGTPQVTPVAYNWTGTGE